MREEDAEQKAEKPERNRKVGGGTAEDTTSARQALTARGDKANDEASLLIEEVLRRENTMKAHKRVVANGGAPGVDGITVDELLAYCREHWSRIREEIRSGEYHPAPVRKVEIPKPGGKGTRMLGIPTVLDRMIQQALLQVLTPLFEPMFSKWSFGFRPGRSALGAVSWSRLHMTAGYRWVVDLDLEKFFDTIPHDKLMKVLEHRIADRSLLKLIRMWLRVPIVEEDDDGRPQVRRSLRGTPQGGVISPLLANAYLHWFDKVFHMRSGPRYWANARLVRYADDFVVLAQYQGERLRQFVEGTIEGWMGLTINREKTRVVNLSKGESLDFLGFTLQYHRDLKGRDHRYLHVMPSKKAMARERAKLRQMTDSRYCFKPIPALIRELNRNLRGWANYFDYGHPRRRFREINWYVRQRLKFHLRRRSQRPFRPPKGVTFYKHLATIGLDSL